MNLQEINYKNEQLNVEMNCYINKKNEIWFRGKEIALMLGYKNPERAVRKYVPDDDKISIETKIQEKQGVTKTVTPRNQTQMCIFINESGFYSLILSSKLPTAKEFKKWVTSKVLPSIRKRGYYDMNSNKVMIQDEYDLHCKVVDFIRNKYPGTLMIAGLGENQRTPDSRIESWKKGYMAGQCDLMIVNPTSKHNSLCIEFKSPAYSNKLSEKQKMMKELYTRFKCRFIVSNNYDDIMFEVIKHLEESEKYLKRRMTYKN